MASYFEADSADELWVKAASALTSGGVACQAESRGGRTRELLHCLFVLHNPRARWVLSRVPAMNPAFAIAEVFWILLGRNDSRFINYWNPVLPRYAGEGNHYHGAYGHRLRSSHGVDQLQRAYEVLRSDPASRQVTLQIWDSRIDLPTDLGSPAAPDIPCNIAACLKVRDGRLSWLQLMRSNDVFLGLPYNIVQFTVLQEVIAGWLGLEVGDFALMVDSLHLYDQNAELMKIGAIPKIDAHQYPSFALSKESFDDVVPRVASALQSLTNSALTTMELRALCNANWPCDYRDFLLICAADAARRREWAREEEWASAQCRRPLLKLAYEAWAQRCRKSPDQTGIGNG